MRLRQDYQSKVEAEHLAIGGRDSVISGYGRAGFDVTVEGVAISGPFETTGEIRAAIEQDWRSADIGGGCRWRGERKTCLVYIFECREVGCGRGMQKRKYMPSPVGEH